MWLQLFRKTKKADERVTKNMVGRMWSVSDFLCVWWPCPPFWVPSNESCVHLECMLNHYTEHKIFKKLYVIVETQTRGSMNDDCKTGRRVCASGLSSFFYKNKTPAPPVYSLPVVTIVHHLARLWVGCHVDRFFLPLKRYYLRLLPRVPKLLN